MDSAVVDPHSALAVPAVVETDDARGGTLCLIQIQVGQGPGLDSDTVFVCLGL